MHSNDVGGGWVKPAREMVTNAQPARLPLPPEGKNGWPWASRDSDRLPGALGSRPWPRVTIVTPSFNQGQFLEETIRSVLLQDYPNLEYIVMDGGSNDGSREIIEKYQDWLAYWVSEPDKGQCDAINQGFARATGDILAWLNSDDVFLSPHVCREALEFFSTYPQLAAVCGTGMFITSQGRWYQLIDSRPLSSQYRQIRYRNSIVQPAAFFRRDVWQALGLDVSMHYAFDWDFFIRVSRDFNLLAVNNVWAGYRMWDSNKTAIGSTRRTLEQATILKRYVGARSWQYLTLRAFALVHRFVDWLPSFMQRRLRRIVRVLSRVISRVSLGRFPVV